jgi:hypothetical protein
MLGNAGVDFPTIQKRGRAGGERRLASVTNIKCRPRGFGEKRNGGISAEFASSSLNTKSF